jgi:uncharacterized membrane protein
MVIRIGSVVLSLSGALALILGLLFWSHRASNLIQLHMMLGFLVVGALWVIGTAQAFSQAGSWLIAASALVIGALVLVLGMIQSSVLVGDFHWIIRVIHLLLGLTAIGIGHMAAARYRKTAPG